MHVLRPQCAHCIYWSADHTASPATAGHCHRYPPAVVINPQTGVVVQKYPTTDLHQWCGEWSDDDTRLVAAVRRMVAARAARGPGTPG
ncbi:MAG: hypothetical protein ACOYLQ_14580 [Hyphomicrobiaceae bacterium]